jgi:hypothetical protein
MILLWLIPCQTYRQLEIDVQLPHFSSPNAAAAAGHLVWHPPDPFPEMTEEKVE